MTGQDDVDIPETGAIFTFGKSRFSDNVPSKFWLRNDQPVHISCGGEHTAVITENGRLLMFGGNTWGQLGMGFKPSACKPASVRALRSEKVKLVACGRDHTIVYTWLGSVYSAGSNQEGQLGLGHCNNTESFHLMGPFFDHAPVKMLSAGCNTSAALTEDGRLFMWGDNAVGQIGLGDEGFAAEPREVNVGEAVTWISCGYHHSAFVTVDGNLYTFGESAHGRLGLQVEQLASHRIPQQVQGIVGCVTQVSCGGEHTVALTEESVYTFGRGQYGQLGHGTFLFQVDVPKPLEHFHNGSIKHIACGESHTAVITNSGLLYTFGDGRHGKLGLEEENYTNQFSPTLCTRFLKYTVELVSCGGNHMLVKAAPRPPESQEVVPEVESSYTTQMNNNVIVPQPALSARARHREKGSPVELFGDNFQNLPRLNSDFLSTTWQTSRNIPTPQMLLKDMSTPSSSPKPQSPGVTQSPKLSHRSRSKSPNLSKSSSPASQASNTSHYKSSVSSKSKSKSPSLSPKSFTKRDPNIPASATKSGKTSLYGVAAAKKVQMKKLPSPQPPKEPCSPVRPGQDISSKHLSDEEHLLQTEGESVQRQLVIEDVEETIADKVVPFDLLPNRKEEKTQPVRRTMQEAELQFHGKTEEKSHETLPSELLKASSSIRKDMSPLKSSKSQKNLKASSKGKENIMKHSSKIKTRKDRQAQKEPSHFVSPHERALPESSRKTPLSAQQRLNEVKENANRKEHLEESKVNKEDIKASSFTKDKIRTPKREKNKALTLDKSSPVTEVVKRNEITSISVQSGGSKPLEIIEKEDAETTNIKPVKVEKQPERRRVKSTLKDAHKVISAPAKSQSKTLQVKPLPVKNETTPATVPAQAGDKKSQSVKSTSVKGKRKLHNLKSTLAQSKFAENTSVKDESRENLHKESNVAKEAAQKMKGTAADQPKMPDVGSLVRGEKKSKSELKAKTKPRGEGGEKVKDTKQDAGQLKDKTNNKQNEALRPQLSQQDPPVEDVRYLVSSQSPKRTEVASISGVQTLQGPGPFDRDVQGDAQDLTEKNISWRDILSTGASLLPVAGLAAASLEDLSEALTSLGQLQSDSDTVASTPAKATRNVKQFTKQSAITQSSFSSTLSTESSNQPGERNDVQVHQESGNVGEDSEESDDQSQVKSVMSEQISGEDVSQTQGRSSDADMVTSLQENERISEYSENVEDNEEEEADTEDKESGSDVEEKEAEHKDSERSNDIKDEEENVSGEDEQDTDSAEDEEETGSSSEQEDGVKDEEERSSEETGEGGSEATEKESETEERSEEENVEEEEESEAGEDESSEESGRAGSKSEESEQEENREVSDNTESHSEEEEEEEDNSEDDSETESDTESEVEEEDSGEDEEIDESEGEEEDKRDEANTDMEEEEESEEEEEEQDEESSTAKEEEEEGDEEASGEAEGDTEEEEESNTEGEAGGEEEAAEEDEGEEEASLDESKAEEEEEGEEDEEGVDETVEEEDEGEVSEEEESEGEGKEEGLEDETVDEEDEGEVSEEENESEEEEDETEEEKGEGEISDEEEVTEGEEEEEEHKEEEEGVEDETTEEKDKSEETSEEEEEQSEDEEEGGGEDETTEEKSEEMSEEEEQSEDEEEEEHGEEEEGGGEDETTEEKDKSEEEMSEEEEEQSEGEEEEEHEEEGGGEGETTEEEEESEEDSKGEEEEEGAEDETTEEKGEEEESEEEEETEEEEEKTKTRKETSVAHKREKSESDEEEEEGGEEEEEGVEEEEEEEGPHNQRKGTEREKSNSEDEVDEEEEGEEEESEEKEAANIIHEKHAGEVKTKRKEEEDEGKSSNTEQVDGQRFPPNIPPSGRKGKQQKEAPKAAPRTKPAAAGQKRPEDSQQFWTDVLPQYLDLQ